MAKEKFEDRKLTGAINVACKYDDGTVRYWSDPKELTIARIKQIVNHYTAEGYVLTLRQLHYQLVTRNWIVNHDTAYKKLGSILDDCRYAGVIDWDAIEDRGRQPYIPYSADDLADGLYDLKSQFRIDRQEGQETYVELWTEKDALSGILKKSTEKYHIQLIVNKGYTSSSAIYNAYERVVRKITKGIKVKILYFGDHDPSGLDMIRDIRERLTFFLTFGDKLLDSYDFEMRANQWWADNDYTLYDAIDEGYCSDKVIKLIREEDEKLEAEFMAGKIHWYLKANDLFEVVPIGLTMDQIKQYNLPHNPAKITDSRAANYIKKFGKQSWEVDALEPQVLTAIVEEHVEHHLNMPLYYETVDKEGQYIEELEDLIKKEKKRERNK